MEKKYYKYECKYCGTKCHSDICSNCRTKLNILKKFNKVRNELRETCKARK